MEYMDQHGFTSVVPVADDPTIQKRLMLDFLAGYISAWHLRVPASGHQRAVDHRNGTIGPTTPGCVRDRLTMPPCGSAPSTVR